MHLIIAIVITSVLTACASNGHHTDTAIMNRNAAKIESTLIVNAVPNHGLQAEIIHSNVGMASGAFMFGAIGGGIAGAGGGCRLRHGLERGQQMVHGLHGDFSGTRIRVRRESQWTRKGRLIWR